MLVKLVCLAGAGAAGTLARYGLAGLVQRHAGAAFPWGTLAVNTLGCFLAGLVWSLAEERGLFSAETRVIMLIGFMGAFTTFSTFALETDLLLRDAQWARALANLLLQNSLGLSALLLGLFAGRTV